MSAVATETGARIVIDWPEPTGVSAVASGDRINILFDRPLASSLAGLPASLPGVVRQAHLSPDRKAATLVLATGHRVATASNGARTTLILTRTAAAAAKPAETKAGEAKSPKAGAGEAKPGATAPAAGVELVKLDYSKTEALERLSFGWRTPVDYGIARRPGGLLVIFKRPGRLDMAAARAKLAGAGVTIEPSTTAESLSVLLRVAPGRHIRYRRNGTAIEFDITIPAYEQPPQAKAGEKEKDAGPKAADGKPAPATPSKTAEAKPAETKTPEVKTPEAKAAKPKPDAMPKASEPPKTAEAPKPPAAQTPKAKTPETKTPEQPKPPEAKPGEGAGAPGDAPKETEAAKPAEAVPGVSLVAGADDPTLRFAWAKPVGAAAFRRGRNIWLVFSAAAALDLAPVRDGLGGAVEAIDLIARPDATIVRIAAPPPIMPHVQRDGAAWVIALRKTEQAPGANLGVEPQPAAVPRPRLLLPTGVAEPVVSLQDPDAGDTLYVVPVREQGLGLDPERRFAQFRLLHTVQGIAIESFADGIAVASDRSGVMITGLAGLHLTGVATAKPPQAKPAPTNVPQAKPVQTKPAKSKPQVLRIFKFAEWRGGPPSAFPATYTKLKQARQLAVIEALSPEVRDQKRMALAEFYFAHGNATDAIGVLAAVDRENKRIATAPAFLALRGASRFLVGQTKEAGNDLLDPGLDRVAEIALWRGAVAATDGDWRTADGHFRRAEGLLREYPPRLRVRLGLLAAETAIQMDQFDRARHILAAVGAAGPAEQDRDMIAYLQAHILARTGLPDDAVVMWQKIAETSTGKPRIRASLARIDTQLALGKLERKEAIAELERLRFAWRGDDIEFRINELLGRVHESAGEYAEALNAFDRARKLDRDLAKTAGVTARMRTIMSALFLKGKAKDLPPLRALGLFYEYTDIVPDGPEGDRMIASLADQLVAIDLLGRAAELLDRQIDRRLRGVERSRVGARLALLQLLDQKPEAALKALDKSAVPDLPEALAAERRRLRARALGSLGKVKEALEIIGPDQSRDADLLRAEIHWKARAWKAAAVDFERLAAAIPKNADTLDEPQSRLVLAWAAALALSNDAKGLAELRLRFDRPMAATPVADAYRVIATDVTGKAADYNAIVAKVAEVDRFQNFMQSYRRRIAQTGLAAIN